ncbi:MAG TPA: adenylate/guanylate cyclase domain-containing protein [Gaiellaceae bacterium]|nr:adenylate/guanylate cyclase domain-containing protein [Gaiellaceae bacterium]
MTGVTQPSGTVTLVFSDIEGSTRLLHELGADAYREALAEHRRIVREAYARYSGYEVDYEGDAFFYAFAFASDAVSAVSEAMQALEGGPIRIRVGIHTGQPILDPPKYVGMDVHFAARVMSAAHGGQVVCSSATAEKLEESTLLPLGSHRLKDIAEPISLYQLGEGSFPALKTIANSNLPTPASSFLGREDELAQADALLQQRRLLTIHGPGGQGKTRFALELATRAREERFSDYPDGVFSCFLSSLRDPALVLATLAHTLSVREQPGQSALEALSGHLQTKRLLLFLDNLEHLLACALELSTLLQACPELTLLVTSRELLRISGEEPYALPPLPQDEGIALFCERSRLEPSPTIADIATRLEGLPLALELAAARTRILTPQQLFERLSSRLDLLKGDRDADPRQQTLRATIEWSYDLLSPQEQALFAKLSVFAGGCTLEAAEEVADADLDLLQSLVDKSLLRFSADRFWMLETIREFAAERLEASGEAEVVRGRQARWVAALARRSEACWYGPEASSWIARFEVDLANVRVAIEWGLANEPQLALAIASNMWYFWAQTDRCVEARRTLEATPVEELPLVEKLSALRLVTTVAMSQNDNAAAVVASQERLQLALDVGDERHTSAAMGMLAGALYETGDVAAAREWFERAILFDRERGWRSVSLGNLGRMERNEGNLSRSRRLLEEDLANSRASGNDIDIAFALKELATTSLEEGAILEACDLTCEGLDIAECAGLRHIVTDLVFGAAMVGSRTRRPHTAALLLGFGDAANEREGFEILPTTTWWWALYDRLVTELGKDELERLRRLGRSFDDGRAVSEARTLLDEVRSSAA